MANKNLHKARKAKNDEFYTRLEDIENELQYYTQHFKGKVVYLNADDPKFSNFWKYFKDNFEQLKLKELISTYFTGNDTPSYVTRLTKDGEERKPLKGNGDFRSDESIELLKEADVVVTNPPFSLFREYIVQLIEYDKKFIVLGNQNAMIYKEVFLSLKENKMWFGNNGGNMYFQVPEEGYGHRATNLRFDDKGNKYISVQGIRWFTTLKHGQTPPPIELAKTYKGNEEDYPKYDNYDAIEVSRVKNIPSDYDGVMGVPITFLPKWNPEQFEVLGITGRQNSSGLRIKKYIKEDSPRYGDLNGGGVIIENGEYKIKYTRILIVKTA